MSTTNTIQHRITQSVKWEELEGIPNTPTHFQALFAERLKLLFSELPLEAFPSFFD